MVWPVNCSVFLLCMYYTTLYSGGKCASQTLNDTFFFFISDTVVEILYTVRVRDEARTQFSPEGENTADKLTGLAGQEQARYMAGNIRQQTSTGLQTQRE